MGENEITTIIKEKTDAIKYAYKDALDILDAYDHQTLTRPKGTYYDGEKRISDALLAALILVIEKSRDEDKEMIIRTALNCIC